MRRRNKYDLIEDAEFWKYATFPRPSIERRGQSGRRGRDGVDPNRYHKITVPQLRLVAVGSTGGCSIA